MTIFRCTLCPLEVELDDGKDEIIEGPCADCIAKKAEQLAYSGTIEVVHVGPEEFI